MYIYLKCNFKPCLHAIKAKTKPIYLSNGTQTFYNAFSCIKIRYVDLHKYVCKNQKISGEVLWPKYGLKSGKPSKMWVFLYEVFFAEIVFLFFLLKGMDHLFEFSARETRKRFSPENSKNRLHEYCCFVLGQKIWLFIHMFTAS